jgi:hypothetical protein
LIRGSILPSTLPQQPSQPFSFCWLCTAKKLYLYIYIY